MSKAGDIAKVSAKGGFNVLWGLVISTVISSVAQSGTNQTYPKANPAHSRHRFPDGLSSNLAIWRHRLNHHITHRGASKPLHIPLLDKKHYSLTVDWRSSAKIILSSALTATLTYAIIAQISFASWIRLLLGVLIFVLILIPTLLFTRSITKSDISNLRSMIGGLGVLSGVISKVLNILEKLMAALKL